MKNRRFSAQVLSGLLLATATLATTACANKIYYYPAYNYSGRPTPPSGILQRVMAAYTNNGSSGGLEILDGLRDIRSNVQNTITSFHISGYSAAEPIYIINYPEQTTGYVLSYTDGVLGNVNYSREASSGAAASFGSNTPSAAAAPDGITFAGAAEQAGVLGVSSNGVAVSLSLPNVDKVVIDQGDSVILAMVRNSNTLYRVVKLPATSTPVLPPGAVDCQPILLPVFCVVPVAGTYDRPTDVKFSVDGTTAYVLNSGPENGGTTASVTFLQEGALNINSVPTINPLSPSAPSPMETLPVANPVPIPGGVTAALSDGSYLYLSGQQLQPSGLFAGYLTVLNLTTYKAGAPISISDGTHTKMLFADDNTLWIGSSQCANGVRAALAATGNTTQAANTNCLTMVTLNGTTAPTAQIIPAVSATATNPVTVPYPNTNQNLYYYGSLTGLCWVQNYHKVYTAYGGQIHAFYTNATALGPAGTEINNANITIQGTVLDVAYMDAATNSAN